MFFTSQKTVLKSYLNTSSIPCYLSSFSSIFLNAISTPPRYLVDRSRKLMPPRKLLDTYWIDRASVLESDSLLLDSFLDTSGIEDQILDSFLDTSRYLNCQALLKLLYISQSRFFSHFFDLSQSVRDCSSPKHSPFHSKPLPQGFFKLFQVSPYLVNLDFEVFDKF